MILDDVRITDQVAIVAGGGAARTKSQLDDIVHQIERTGRSGLTVVTDATIDEDWRLDILVNNAGGTAPRLHLNATARRTGAPRDIAAAVVYLASPASSWVTGVPRVDGGTTAPAFTIPVPPLQSQAR